MNPINKNALRAAALSTSTPQRPNARMRPSICRNTLGTTFSNSGGGSNAPAGTVGTRRQIALPRTCLASWTIVAANWKMPFSPTRVARRSDRFLPRQRSIAILWVSSTNSRRWTSASTSTNYRSPPIASSWREFRSAASKFASTGASLAVVHSLIASLPSILIRPLRVTTSPIPMSKMNNCAKAKAALPFARRWPSAVCTTCSY